MALLMIQEQSLSAWKRIRLFLRVNWFQLMSKGLKESNRINFCPPIYESFFHSIQQSSMSLLDPILTESISQTFSSPFSPLRRVLILWSRTWLAGSLSISSRLRHRRQSTRQFMTEPNHPFYSTTSTSCPSSSLFKYICFLQRSSYTISSFIAFQLWQFRARSQALSLLDYMIARSDPPSLSSTSRVLLDWQMTVIIRGVYPSTVLSFTRMRQSSSHCWQIFLRRTLTHQTASYFAHTCSRFQREPLAPISRSAEITSFSMYFSKRLDLSLLMYLTICYF